MQNTMMNKNGISSTIAVVMLILIASISVALISVYIINSSKSIQLSPESSCLDLKLSTALKIESACYNKETNEVKVIVSRNINTEQLSKIDFAILSSDKIEKWEVGGSCLNCRLPEQGESKIYDLDSTSIEQRTIILFIDGCELDKKDIPACINK